MIFRAILVLILLFPLAGFGICGVLGVVQGLISHEMLIALLGLLGIGISVVIGYFIVQLLKAKKTSQTQSNE